MVLQEFPTVRIDDFRLNKDSPAPEIGFLTHMHEDHTAGLSRKSFYGPLIYCTAATRAMLLNFRTNYGEGELKYAHLRQEVGGKEIVRILEYDRSYIFRLHSITIEVTLIDANHCPGAAMVLIKQQDGPAILFTGDLRCEQWHLDKISRSPSLLPYLKTLGDSQLSLYIDDTYAHHVDPFKSYIENRAGVIELLDLLRRYPNDVHFCLADQTTGYEEVLIFLARKFNTKIHMSVYMYNVYMCASDTSPVAAKLLELSTLESGPNARLHFCQRNMKCSYRQPHSPMAYFKPCNQPSREQVAAQNELKPLLSTKPGDLTPLMEAGQEDRVPLVFKNETQRYFLDANSKMLYPLFPWFFFSRHASFPELTRFHSMFNTSDLRSIHGTPINSFSIIGRKAMIPKFNDRTKTQNLRKLLREVRDVSNGSLPSDEESEAHDAMEFLCKKPRLSGSQINEECSPKPASQQSPPTPPSSPNLTERLRKHPSEWFDMKFDYQRQILYKQ